MSGWSLELRILPPSVDLGISFEIHVALFTLNRRRFVEGITLAGPGASPHGV
jgi:hypothetical protein